MAVILNPRQIPITPFNNVMNSRDPNGTGSWESPDSGVIAVNQTTTSVNEDAGTITLSATRSGGNSGAASVQWETQDGTAQAGTDYVSDSGTLNWNDGQTGSRSATISIIDRSGDEQGDTQFAWKLSSASGASIEESEDGSLKDTTTVTILDQDGATDEVVDFVWRGDGSSGDWLQYHAIGDPDQFHFWRIPEYGRPVEWGGDGSLARIVTNVTRGPNRPQSFLFVCKNSANGTETDDCDVPNDNCTRRSSHTPFPAMHADYRYVKHSNEYFMSGSVYIPSSGFWTGGSGWGPHLFGYKGAMDANTTGSGSPVWNISMEGPNNSWSFNHRTFYGQYTTDPEWEWQYLTKYNADFSWGDGSSDFAVDDAPDFNVTVAALESVNLDGWTDWIVHLRWDHRSPNDGGNGFLNLYKREDNGPWVHVLQILPKNSVSRAGLNNFPRGIGTNVDGFYASEHGLYMHKDKVWPAPNNWEMYFTNHNVYSSSSTFQGISDFMKAGS